MADKLLMRSSEALAYMKERMTISEKFLTKLVKEGVIKRVESPGFYPMYQKEELDRVLRDGFVRIPNGKHPTIKAKLPEPSVKQKAEPEVETEPLVLNSPREIQREIFTLLTDTGRFSDAGVERIMQEETPSWVRDYIARRESEGWAKREKVPT